MLSNESVIQADRSNIPCHYEYDVTENVMILHFNDVNTRAKDSPCILLKSLNGENSSRDHCLICQGFNKGSSLSSLP